MLTPPDKPYTELGSVEGTARSIEHDGWGRLVLYIHSRLTGEEVKCFVSGEAAEALGEHQICVVWRSRRLQVYGTRSPEDVRAAVDAALLTRRAVHEAAKALQLRRRPR